MITKQYSMQKTVLQCKEEYSQGDNSSQNGWSCRIDNSSDIHSVRC